MARESMMDEAGVLTFLKSLFAEDLHAKRVLSLAHCTLGVIHAASPAIHAIKGDSADNPPGEPRGWRFRVVALAQAMP